ncbi:hypothetical protein DFH28DRAFT_950234 [Melampsora americana]|nr:hypothetical protein DFH28DRAFT_950234 [Melampsora americana]
MFTISPFPSHQFYKIINLIIFSVIILQKLFKPTHLPSTSCELRSFFSYNVILFPYFIFHGLFKHLLCLPLMHVSYIFYFLVSCLTISIISLAGPGHLIGCVFECDIWNLFSLAFTPESF